MTAAPFTEAARESAEQFLWALPDDHPAKPLHNDGFMQTHARVVADLMADWARTHLTATLTANDSQSGSQSADAERAVRDLHHERKWRPLDGTFIGGTVCNACRRPYPCPTISVLDRDRAARRDEEKRDG